MLAGAFAAGAGVSTPASAADAGPVASVVNGNVPDKVSGTNFDTVQIAAPAPCVAAATRHVVKITDVVAERPADRASAQEWVGDNLYATASHSLPGPLTVKSSNSLQGLADTFAQELVPGRYVFVLRCQDNLGTQIYEEWEGGVVFTSPTSWKGFVGSAPGSAPAAGAADGAVTASPAASPSASPSPSGAGSTASPESPDGSTSPAPIGADPTESAAASGVGTAGDGDDAAGGDGTGLAATGATVTGLVLLAGALLAVGAALRVAARRRREHPSTIRPSGR